MQPRRGSSGKEGGHSAMVPLRKVRGSGRGSVIYVRANPTVLEGKVRSMVELATSRSEQGALGVCRSEAGWSVMPVGG